MKKKSWIMLVAMGFACISSAVEVGNVAGRQRWPWNGLVDVDFTMSDVDSSETWYRVSVVASYSGVAGKGIRAKTFASDSVVRGAGAHRVVWNMEADYPGVVTSNLVLSVEVAPLGDLDPVYLVIDLSAGPEASSYPLRYTFAAPDLADDTCRMTELWLKRVPAGTFTMGSGTGSPKTIAAHSVRLTKPFYMAVFPTTQKQWERVMGDWPSYFTNDTCRAGRPVEQVSFARVRGHAGWYSGNASPGTDTFVGRLRSKSGIAGVELPSEAQWEYVCRAGTTGEYYFNGTAVQVRNYARTANWDGTSTDDRNQDLTKGTAKVGSYPANPWGFYDFYGNVCQFVPDGAKQNSWKGLTFGTDLTEDPRWAFADDESVVFSGIRRGSSWREAPGTVSSSCRRWTQFLNSDGSAYSGDSAYGFRICVNAE